MKIQITLNEFENALPKHFKTHYKLCHNCGMVNGEFLFILPVNGTPSVIKIYSTIKEDKKTDISDRSGIKIICDDVKIVGLPKHIKRTKHWSKRLNLYLKYAYIYVFRHYVKDDIEYNKLSRKLQIAKLNIDNYMNEGKRIGKQKSYLNM